MWFGSGIVCNASDVLGMSVTKGVGAVCEMCLAWGGIGGDSTVE